MKRFFRFIVALAFFAAVIGGIALYADYRNFLDQPLATGEEVQIVTVAKGSSLGRIAGSMYSKGWINRPEYMRIYGRIHDLAPRIQAGDYAIAPGTTPVQLLNQLVSGKVIQLELTIVEGWTFKQMMDAVRASPYLKQTLAGLSDAEIMAGLGHSDEHPEGRFFPDTYHFPLNTSDVDFLRRAYDTMEKELANAWAERDPELPLETPYQALILASIIEKETGIGSERREIGGVFARRLIKGMRLQTDPTVIYGMGDSYDGNIRREDLRTDTPYNTYTRKGLTPTPIALPGRGALDGAVNPAAGTALYFVANGEGGHTFSDTLAQHNRAVRAYIKKTGG